MQKLKIIWFVNILFPAVANALKVSGRTTGWWMIALHESLSRRDDVQLTVVTSSRLTQSLLSFSEGGTQYHVIPEARSSTLLSRFSPRFLKHAVATAVGIVHDAKPDIVVVHGTEGWFGLISESVAAPVLVELQGILNAYLPHYWGAANPVWTCLRHPAEAWRWFCWRMRARTERKVFRLNRYYCGHSTWDHAHSRALSPDFCYWRDQHFLRAEFFATDWSIDQCDAFSVVTTTTPQLLKGTILVVEAINIVRRYFPQVRLRIAGPMANEAASVAIRALVKRYQLDDCVDFLGYLSVDPLLKVLTKAHVFALPSYIENAPLSLSEAQAIGVPSVAARCGGVSDMVEHMTSGLLFNVGDAAMLAHMILIVFNNPDLARAISLGGRQACRSRHEHLRCVDEHLAACRSVIATHRSSLGR